MGWFKDRQLISAGRDKEKAKQQEVILDEIETASKVDNSSDSIDTVRDRLRDRSNK